MKEIRGIAAAGYAGTRGIGFLIDESFLTQAEGTIQNRPVAIDDIDHVIEEQTGFEYDPTDVHQDSPIFKFLIDRYGDGWIYVPIEGKHLLDEERAVIELFEGALTAQPRGGDILEIAANNPSQLRDTGFPARAEVDLLFHAARRLVDKGVLEAVEDDQNYGRVCFRLRAK